MMSSKALPKRNHYEETSNNYHSAFFYTGEYENWQLCKILKCLDLSRSSRLVDIGGGTGRFASLLYDNAKLECQVTCVDPSPQMLSQANDLPGVDPICCDAVEFALKNEKEYDRVLMKEIVHHLGETELKTTFSALFNNLSKRGKLVVCTRPHVVEYPFFDRAHDVWKRNQRPKEYYVLLLKQTGFHVTSVEVAEYPVTLDLKWWTDMVLTRFWSTFSEFSDDELSIGIEEIKKKYGKSDTIGFLEKMVFIVAEKVDVTNA